MDEKEKMEIPDVKLYQEKIVEVIGEIEDENELIKIYTVAKTLKEILDEKKGG